MDQYTTHTYRYGCAEIVVYRPILDEQERRKREETLRRALTSFGKAMVRGGERDVLSDRRPDRGL